MSLSFGSGQTNGAPLLITGTTLGAAQVLHTAIAAAGTPELIALFAFNTSDAAVPVTVSLYDAAAVLIRSFVKLISAKAFLQPLLDDGGVEADLILNGTIAIKVHAETASVISMCARVDPNA